ncbi:hypothetical protein JHK82_043228 [Glycine max]|nr:hypothetical protein JHK86_043266 [Glycine max]KAG5106258.1 hypothetical protein JHK82_043228 [Glycine max]
MEDELHATSCLNKAKYFVVLHESLQETIREENKSMTEWRESFGHPSALNVSKTIRPGDDNLDTMEFQVDSGDVGGSTTSTNEDVIPIMSKFDGINLNDYYMSCDTLLSSRRTPYPVKLGFEERIDQVTYL